MGVDGPAAEVGALGDDHALGILLGKRDVGGDGIGLVLDVDDVVLAHRHAGEEDLGIPLDQRRATGHGGNHALRAAVVQRQDVVAGRFDQELPLQLGQLVGHLRGQVVGLRPVGVGVVQLPDVVVEGGRFRRQLPGDGVAGHRRPAVVVDAAVAEHLEVLDGVPVFRRPVVEAVAHARRLPSATAARPRRRSARGFPPLQGCVGATSMTWWNWGRISPLAVIPFGQWTMVPLRVPPQWEATCLVHW